MTEWGAFLEPELRTFNAIRRRRKLTVQTITTVGAASAHPLVGQGLQSPSSWTRT